MEKEEIKLSLAKFLFNHDTDGYQSFQGWYIDSYSLYAEEILNHLQSIQFSVKSEAFYQNVIIQLEKIVEQLQHEIAGYERERMR